MRVLLIGDDDVDRAGFAQIAGRAGHDVIPARWADLQEGSEPPRPVDRVLALLRPDPERWDRYHVLPTLHRLHRDLGPRIPITAVVESCAPTNPLLMLRVHDAGATNVARRDDLADATALLDALEDHETVGLRPRPSASDLADLGVGHRTDPTRAISELLRLGRLDETYLAAFTPGRRQSETGLSRRRAHTLRIRLAEIGDLAASPRLEPGSGIDPALPRWSAIATYVNLARGAVAACGHGVDDHRPLQALAT